MSWDPAKLGCSSVVTKRSLEDTGSVRSQCQVLPMHAGKSSVLLAMLGELRLSSGGVRGWGRVAYVQQSPWLLAATFRHVLVHLFWCRHSSDL